MRAREWIILRPPEAGWMVLTADFRHVAVPTILTRLDKEPPVLNSSGEVGNRISNFFADFAGKPLRVETCGDQRSSAGQYSKSWPRLPVQEFECCLATPIVFQAGNKKVVAVSHRAAPRGKDPCLRWSNLLRI